MCDVQKIDERILKCYNAIASFDDNLRLRYKYSMKIRWEDLVKQNIKNFKKYTFLLEQLVKKEIKLKYRSSVLGVFWTLLEPILTMLVLTLVFESMFRKGIEYIPVYILSGRLLYTFFSNSTKAATKSIRKNGAMIKKVYVPKYIYPLSAIIANYIMFLISLVVLVITALFLRMPITWHIVEIIIPLALLFVMCLGVGLILATMSVFFRDLEYLWGVALMLIMYTCAIFYHPNSLIDAGKGWVLDLNPLYAIIANFRNSLYGLPQDTYYLVFAAIFSFASLFIGLFAFYKNQDKFILNI